MNNVVFNQKKKELAKVEDSQANKNFGKVPKYINKFNQQREDARRQKEIEEEIKKMPPGTRLMPEDER